MHINPLLNKMNLFVLLLTLLLFMSCGDDPIPPEHNNQGVRLSVEDQIVVDGINEEGFKIQADPLTIPNDQLSIFDVFSDVRIVGLGEATHGTREFFEMKHRIFQYLVEEHGYDAFVFEMDVAEARIFNDWVQGRRDDDLDELMPSAMLFWTWNTEEVKALLEWMRDYNEQHPPSESIGFYGVDSQFPNYDVTQLKGVLDDVGDPRADDIFRETFEYSHIWNQYRDNFSEGLRSKVLRSIEFTKEAIDDNQEKIKTVLGPRELLWANHLVRHMEQVEEVVFQATQNGTNPGARDQFMAENTAWFFELLGEDVQIALWAHNAHLANNVVFGGTGSQGAHLKRDFGDNYQIIGFSFAKGAFTAFDRERRLGINRIDEDPLFNSTNELLYHSELDNFILPMTTDHFELNEWLRNSRRFLSIGAVFNGSPARNYLNIQAARNYDYIIHFDVTNSSQLIDS